MELQCEKSSEDKRQEKTKINIDTILIEEIGQFGKYQLRTAGLCVILVIFIAWSGAEYIFTTARIRTRCLIPECETGESTTEFAPFWMLNAIPGDSIDSFDNCKRYSNATSSTDTEFLPQNTNNDTCHVSLFDNNSLEACKEYLYENTHSVVYDYNLACEEWRRSFIGSIRTVGTLIALPITGIISDHWGRRTALIINVFNNMWLGVVRYWAGTYTGFMMLEFTEAIFGGGSYSCTYILLMELVGPKYRVVVGATMSTAFSLGQLLLGLIAWAVPNWRNLTLAIYIPQIILISYVWLLSESVRWYMSKGRYEESAVVLKKVAKFNGKQLSDKSMNALRQTIEEEIGARAMQNKKKEPWLIVKVFRNKKILIRCIVTPIWWITCVLIYYGLSINSVNLIGNKYLNYVAVAASEIPGYWLAVYLLGKIGRKLVLMGAFWVCAASQFAFVFIPNDCPGLSLTVYLIGTSSIAMVFTSIYTYTAELYPTVHRHSLFAFSSMLGRLGNIAAPLTPAIGTATFYECPFILFGCLAFLSGCLMFVTPETLGTRLPDTMEEACNIGIKKNNSLCEVH